jgi:hypothetical protein
VQTSENPSGGDVQSGSCTSTGHTAEENDEATEHLSTGEPTANNDRPTLQCQINELSASLTSLVDEVDDIQESLGGIDKEISTLHTRLNSVLGERTRARTDLASGPHSRHLEIASHYRALIDQNLQHVARLGSKHRRSRVPQRERVARIIGKVCQSLFGGTFPTIDEIYELLGLSPEDDNHQLVERAYSEALDIRESIEQAGLEHSWFFGIEKGAAMLPALQEPWPPCDPEASVKFLVAPGYLADNQIICRQRVYLTD